MKNSDLNKVVFYSKEDMAGGHQLQKGEHVLRSDIKSNYTDINDIFELYNIKKYIDNELYLKSWTNDDITNFKQKATEFGKVIGQFMATINDSNVVNLYENTLQNYVHSFWELVNNQSVFKRISKPIFSNILSNEPYIIYEILTHKNIVDHYDKEIRLFLLTYSQSAEILLSVYEVKDDFQKNQKFIPKSLSVDDKETIISNYLDSNDVNYNYIGLIQNVRNRNDFKVSDKTRLKAKRLHKSETEKFFAENNGMKYGVSVSFPEKTSKVKDGVIDENFIINYTYSLDFIKQNCDPFHSLIKHIWWAEKIDDGDIVDLEYKRNENPYLDEEKIVCYKYTAKKAGKIRIYAYVASPAEKVSIEVPIISFPFCVDRYKIPGLNNNGTNIAPDLTFGRGIAVKNENNIYTAKEVERYKSEYIANGFDVEKHAEFANIGFSKRGNPFDKPFDQSKPQAGSDYFNSVQQDIDRQNRAKAMQIADEFDKGSYEKAIYSKEEIYNAKAWLIDKWVYEHSGKDVKDYHEGNLLFWDTSDENMFKAFEDWATMCFSYGEMQGNIKRMISKFKSNEGGVYEDPVLTKDIAEHKATKEFCKYLEEYMAGKLKSSNGKFSTLVENQIDFDIEKRRNKGKLASRPIFNSTGDKFKGETIALNDIWATEIYIKQIQIANNKYTINYTITLWDHFGLDISDIQKIPNTIPFAKEAFAVWFALQHLRGYKPFLTKMTFEKKFVVNIDHSAQKKTNHN